MACCGTRKWFFAAAVVLAIVLWAALSGARHARVTAGPEVSSTVLNIGPVASLADAGPVLVVGADAEPGGARFVSADVLIDGAGDFRAYFDRVDNATFHFLDRKASTVTLGISEAGMEHVFATGTLETTGPLRIARHAAHIGVFQDAKLIASAFDDRLVGGTIGVRMLDASASPVTVRAEPREDVHFADDFMITEGKGAQWRGNGAPGKGDFKVESLRHPLLSANAFNYMGAGTAIYSVAGQPWWDRYSYEVSLRGPGTGSIGLIFAFQDERNYGLFRWSARKLDDNGAVTEVGKREIVRVRGGTEEVVARADGGYLMDQWYAAQVRVTYSRVTVTMDGHVVLEASDPCLTAGQVGVWCDVPVPATPAQRPKEQQFTKNSLWDLMHQHAVFDDVRVNTLEGFEDDFRVVGTLAGGWLVGTGEWTVVSGQAAAGKPGELRVKPVGSSSKALIGDRRWAQYEVDADVRPGAGPAGLVFLHRDESNYYAATVDNAQLRLTAVVDGRAQVVDNAPITPGDKPVRMRVAVRHGHIRVTADGTASVETFAGDVSLRGRAGFIAASQAWGNGPSAFSRFRVSFLPEREPLVTTNAIFEDELTMSDWTSPTSEWYTPREQLMVDGRPVNLLWHRSQFPGDVELGVEPREFTDPAYDVALSVAKDGQGRNNGYVFRFKVGDAAAGPSRSVMAMLFRQGELKMERPLAEDVRQLSNVSMRRSGKYIMGLVNGRPVVSYRDEQPLVGNKVAFYTQGVTVRSEATKITSNAFRNDLFSSAPTGWRTAGTAIAEVANRWQCDPRWTFFALENDVRKRRPAPAVLWSKYLYPGDVTIEFFVGTKMEAERGTPYHYTRDINVTIGSDGADLNKGYTFMWGGYNNSRSVILRDGVEVKGHRARIPTTMDYHRHWYSYRIEKQGGKLTFRVDRFFSDEGSKQAEMVYQDTQPLQGGHVAIWTYDNAIMLSRVRISGDGGDVMDDPDWQPGPLKTPYDKP